MDYLEDIKYQDTADVISEEVEMEIPEIKETVSKEVAAVSEVINY